MALGAGGRARRQFPESSLPGGVVAWQPAASVAASTSAVLNMLLKSRADQWGNPAWERSSCLHTVLGSFAIRRVVAGRRGHFGLAGRNAGERLRRKPSHRSGEGGGFHAAALLRQGVGPLGPSALAKVLIDHAQVVPGSRRLTVDGQAMLDGQTGFVVASALGQQYSSSFDAR